MSASSAQRVPVYTPWIFDMGFGFAPSSQCFLKCSRVSEEAHDRRDVGWYNHHRIYFGLGQAMDDEDASQLLAEHPNLRMACQ
jgi:hypothetical protein